MIIQRSYPAMCRECNGTGRLADQTTTTNPYRVCPVCNGTGVIMIIETITDGISEHPINYIKD
jgi:DnaJ-class molecular chaperone